MDDAPGTADATVRSGSPSGDVPIVAVESTDAFDDSWFGDAVPMGATMGLPKAYRNRFEREGPVCDPDVAVVSNDPDETEEGSIATDVYGSLEELPFHVSFYEDLDRDGLGELLTADLDFLHYVGHISDGGFHCHDGRLDAAELDGGAPDVFFLNGCESYRQGRHLVEAGSVGGVVTIGEVIDSGAAAVGRTMARLLILGFTLRTALALARRESIVGGQYIVMGQGHADVASARRGGPIVCDVDAVGDGRFDLTIQAYLPREAGMGATVTPTLAGHDEHSLAPGTLEFRVTGEELRSYLAWHPYPVRRGESLIWDDRYEAIQT